MVRQGSARADDGASSGDGSVPVAVMVETIVGCKWSVRLLETCAQGHRRPSALLRACPGLSAKVLNERLRKMVRFGILRRTVFGTKPPIEVEYVLTPLGLRFIRLLDEVTALQLAIDEGRLDAAESPGTSETRSRRERHPTRR
jgi:DNA-binding HxlR family transcriptional regulator